MNKTSIEWCDYTWNPVTGCQRGCPYCYAKKFWDLRHRKREGCKFTHIKYHPDRLMLPRKVKKPSLVFVGSMSDIQYWRNPWLAEILGECMVNPQCVFMFLSKNAQSFDRPMAWPRNTMQGLTVTHGRPDPRMDDLPRPFLSIEPILGPVTGISPKFELVIIGAQTGAGAAAAKPRPEWIQGIKNQVPSHKLCLKDSLGWGYSDTAEAWLQITKAWRDKLLENTGIKNRTLEGGKADGT